MSAFYQFYIVLSCKNIIIFYQIKSLIDQFANESFFVRTNSPLLKNIYILHHQVALCHWYAQ